MIPRSKQPKIHVYAELTENETSILDACVQASGKTRSEVIADALSVLYIAIPREGENFGRANGELAKYRGRRH